MTDNIDFEKRAKEIFEEHNKYRNDPKSYLEKLASWKNKFRDKTLYLITEIHPLLTFEGIDGIKKAMEYLSGQNKVFPLEYSKELSLAAMDHAKDIGKNGLTTHEGSDGSDLTARIERYTEWDGMCAESIDFGFSDPCNIICNLIVDDGMKEKFQRNNLLSKDFKYVGVGMAPHRDFGFVCVIVYAKELRNIGVQPTERFDYIQDYIQKTFNKKKPANDFQNDDVDAPDNTVDMKIVKLNKVINGQPKKITKKIYTLDDKTQHIVEIEEN